MLQLLSLVYALLQVWEEHKLLVKTDGGFVAEIAATNNAPKGDCFVARVQLCGVFISSSTSSIRISMKVGKPRLDSCRQLTVSADHVADQFCSGGSNTKCKCCTKLCLYLLAKA